MDFYVGKGQESDKPTPEKKDHSRGSSRAVAFPRPADASSFPDDASSGRKRRKGTGMLGVLLLAALFVIAAPWLRSIVDERASAQKGNGAWVENVLMGDCPMAPIGAGDGGADSSELWNSAGSQPQTVFGSKYLRSQIATITFENTLSKAPMLGDSWDVSADRSGRVKAWVKKSKTDGLYDLYIAADGGVNAPDCRGMFAFYPNLTGIDFNDAFHSDQAVSMERMFAGCTALTELQLGTGFSTKSLTNASQMFAGVPCVRANDLVRHDWRAVQRYDDFLDGSGWEWLFAEDAWRGSLLMQDYDDTIQDYKKQPVLKSEYMRNQIAEVYFLDHLESAPEDAWDVSADESGRVLAWVRPRDSMYELYIAGYGGIHAATPKGLFIGYDQLKTLTLPDFFHTDDATNLYAMFYGCRELTELTLGTGFVTDNMTNMNWTFAQCGKLKKLTARGVISTAECAHFRSTFEGCAELTELDENFRIVTDKAEHLEKMFKGSGIEVSDINHIDWNSKALCDEFMDGSRWKWLFQDQNVLMTDDPWANVWGSESFDWSSCYAYPVLGNEKYQRQQICSVTFLDTLKDKPNDAWDVSRDGDGSVMAWIGHNGGLYDLYIAGNGGVSAIDCTGLFAGYKKVESYHFDGNFSTDDAVSMKCMFIYNSSIATIDVSDFDTYNCTDMFSMFYGCTALEEFIADPECFLTVNAENISFMFNETKLEPQDLEAFEWNATNYEYGIPNGFMKGDGWEWLFTGETE